MDRAAHRLAGHVLGHAGQLESHGRLRTVKRDIARIYTVVRERELGIRQTPGADDAQDGAA